MAGSDGYLRLPVIVGEKGVFWCVLTVKGTPGHGSQPLRTDNALVKAAEVVRRIDEYRPEAQLHEALDPLHRRSRLAARAGRSTARPCPHRPVLRRAAPARTGPPGPRLHPHHHGPDHHARGHQDERDPRPGRSSTWTSGRCRAGTPTTSGTCWTTCSDDLADDVEVEFRSEEEATTSPIDTPLWDALRRASQQFYPGALTVPFLTAGATDARYARTLGAVAYGFGLHSQAIDFEQYGAMFHGIDERVDVESLRLSTEMWMALARDFLVLTTRVRTCRPGDPAGPVQPTARRAGPPARAGAARRCPGRAGRLRPAHVAQGVGVADSRWRRPWTKFQAPMFSGSSCSHTTSPASA